MLSFSFKDSKCCETIKQTQKTDDATLLPLFNDLFSPYDFSVSKKKHYFRLINLILNRIYFPSYKIENNNYLFLKLQYINFTQIEIKAYRIKKQWLE